MKQQQSGRLEPSVEHYPRMAASAHGTAIRQMRAHGTPPAKIVIGIAVTRADFTKTGNVAPDDPAGIISREIDAGTRLGGVMDLQGIHDLDHWHGTRSESVSVQF